MAPPISNQGGCRSVKSPALLEESEFKGDGGKVASPLAEVALERRGNERMRNELEEQNRIYSSVDQRQWEHKYKFFSGRHMERSYRLFTKARHDPFNKDPSWGRSIIHRVAEACRKKKIEPKNLFGDVDVTGDGILNRPEMKRVVVGVLPTLSDEELTAFFDTMDGDKRGEVNVSEFCDTIHKGRNSKVPPEKATRWRNPIHRIKRFSPAQVEGWDHLEGDLKFQKFDNLCGTMQSEMQGRLGDTLAKSARGAKSVVAPKYTFFGGGGDGDRFTRALLRKERAENPSSPTVAPRIKDPGPFPKPGWMYNIDMRARTDKHGTKFQLPRTPLTAR